MPKADVSLHQARLASPLAVEIKHAVPACWCFYELGAHEDGRWRRTHIQKLLYANTEWGFHQIWNRRGKKHTNTDGKVGVISRNEKVEQGSSATCCFTCCLEKKACNWCCWRGNIRKIPTFGSLVDLYTFKHEIIPITSCIRSTEPTCTLKAN